MRLDINLLETHPKVARYLVIDGVAQLGHLIGRNLFVAIVADERDHVAHLDELLGAVTAWPIGLNRKHELVHADAPRLTGTHAVDDDVHVV